MNLSRDNRLSIALVLYLCTLFSVLTVGFHQGQMSAQHLSGAGVVFCNLGSQNLVVDLDGGQQKSPSGDLQLSCPLCSSAATSSTLTSFNWSLNHPPITSAVRLPASNWAQPAPRHAWPALNPRASPAAHRAAALPA